MACHEWSANASSVALVAWGALARVRPEVVDANGVRGTGGRVEALVDINADVAVADREAVLADALGPVVDGHAERVRLTLDATARVVGDVHRSHLTSHSKTHSLRVTKYEDEDELHT